MATDVDILCDFIRTEIGYDGQLNLDIDLLQAQILDSFSVVQLAIFIQDRFGIELEAEDLVRANLSTLARIIALIDKRRAVTGQ